MRRFLAIAALLIAAVPASAQDVGRSWETWTRDGSCFALLYPKEGAIEKLSTPKAYLTVKHTPAEDSRNSIAIVSGIDEADGLAGRADVDGKLFELLVYNGNGYVKTGEREDALLESMLAGQELRITWTGPSGMMVQVYDLNGMTLAKRAIDSACYPD